MVSEIVELAFRWRVLGEVTLDGLGKLLFPQASTAPGVYRLEVDDEEASVYFGEAIDLDQRFGRYRNAGRRQPTNVRIQELLCRVLSAGGHCRVSVAEILSFETGRHEARLDLRLKAARVLVESAAIVLARNDGMRPVLNLDPTFDRSLGGH
jgi:hypothetical protein